MKLNLLATFFLISSYLSSQQTVTTSGGDFTSNNYKISHTLTLDGNLSINGILADITITNNKVLATSVIIANANLKVKIDVHSVVNGSFKVRITNMSGSAISSDIIINYLVL